MHRNFVFKKMMSTYIFYKYARRCYKWLFWYHLFLYWCCHKRVLLIYPQCNFSNDSLRMWPDKRVQNYIGLKVITLKVISDKSLIEKLREVLDFGLTQGSFRPVHMIYPPSTVRETGWKINYKDRSIRSLCKAKSRQLLSASR